MGRSVAGVLQAEYTAKVLSWESARPVRENLSGWKMRRGLRCRERLVHVGPYT